jgi:hypothetical protein
MVALGLFLAADAQAQTNGNRGIGLYPGSKAEYTAPRLVTDNTYCDLALHRTATASSSLDYNLTAQLATDGLLTRGEPVTLTVTNNGVVDRSRDRLKGIDGSCVTPYYVYHGQDATLQYLWTGMTIHADTLRLCFETAYDEKKTHGWRIDIEGTTDGTHWTNVGSTSGDDLPGYKTQETVSTDPNKQTGQTDLPLRRGIIAIPLSRKHAAWKGLRLHFTMPSAVWWRIRDIDEGPADNIPSTFQFPQAPWKQRNMSWLPSEHFYSAWISAPVQDTEPQWLKVDLGAKAEIGQLRIHWLYAAKSGEVQVSDDDAHWSTVATFAAAHDKTVQKLSCKAQGRYVRLWLTQPQGRVYGVTELEVLGRGGLTVLSANTLNLGSDKLSLNKWQICRDLPAGTEPLEGASPWIEATVPGTALTSYINIGAVPETTIANNMRQISESFFNADFTYKTNLIVRNGIVSNGKAIYPINHSYQYLCFDGIDWRAVVELNGHRLGRIDGAFTRARFDISGLLKEGNNELVVHVKKNAHPGPVKIKNDQSTDLNGGVLGADNPTFHPTIGWDWITSTPGRCMGIWNDVYLTQDNGLSLADPLVTTVLNFPDTLVTLTPAVRVVSHRKESAKVTLSGWIGPLRFSKDITVGGGEAREVSFSPEEYRQLARQQMRLWWPNGYGDPYRYDAGFSLVSGTDTLYTLHYKAGLRQMSAALVPSPDGDGKRLHLFVNGVRVDPLGGNWGFPEANLRYRGREYDAAVCYHRDMNMNMIRNWVGQVGDDEFYDACDKYGIMVWQDFWLANPWDGPDPDDESMFMQNARDIISRIRRHPSIALYCGRNEGYPPATLQQALKKAIETLHPQLSYIGSSADDVVSGHGPYGLKPIAWYFSHLYSKFHSEEGLQNIPTWESVQRFLGPDGLSQKEDTWGQHDFCLEGAPQGKNFNAIMIRLFGKSANVKQYTEWAQWLDYDGHRAMFESWQTNRQGLLMWMSHPCWPSFVWQTYDYYFDPTAAYFAIKKACEPLHIQYNPAKQEVEVINISRVLRKPLTAEMQMLDVHGNVLDKKTRALLPARDNTVVAFADVSAPDKDLWFLRLRLLDGATVVSDNFYVEGRKPDSLSNVTKILGKPQLSMDRHFEKQDDEWIGKVTVKNTGDNPALFIRLKLVGSDGEQILPVLYSDNYFALMPGESETIDVRFSDADCRGTQPDIVCSNIME